MTYVEIETLNRAVAGKYSEIWAGALEHDWRLGGPLVTEVGVVQEEGEGA